MKSPVLRPTALDPEFWMVSTLPVPTLLAALDALDALDALAEVAAVLVDPKVENGEKLTVIDRLLSCHDVEGRPARGGRPR
jgi:hypothetical protein